MKLSPETPQELAYLFSPRAEWKFAVSRRFRDPLVDSIYGPVVLPVLDSEGLVLECSHASEDTEDYDYWINRMNVIFELADIHVLIDINRTPSLEVEIERSNSLARYRRTRALTSSFRWALTMSHEFLSSYRIFIKQGAGRDSRSRTKRKATLHFTEDTSREDFANRLKAHIHWAKGQRLIRLRRIMATFTRRIRFLGDAADEIDFTFIKMTELARRIKSGERIEHLIQSAEELNALQDQHLQQLINDTAAWRLKLKTGEFEIPASFRDTRVFLRDYILDSFASAFSPKAADYWAIRLLASAGAFVEAIRIRRTRRLTHLPPESQV